MKEQILEILEGFRRWWKHYLSCFLSLALVNVLAALIPQAVRLAIDSGEETGIMESPWFWPCVILGLALIQSGFRILSRVSAYRACREQEHEFRMRLMERVLNAGLSRIARIRRGELITNMLEDTSQLRLLYGFGFIQASNILLLYSSVLPFMISIQPELTLYSVAPYPVLLVWVAFINQKLYYLNLEVKEKVGELAGFAMESVQGIHVIHSHAAQESMSGEYAKRVREHFDVSWKTARFETLLLPGMIFLAGLGEWAVLYKGVPMIQAGTLSKGEFLAFHGYVGTLLFASIAVGFGVSTFNRGVTSLKRLMGRWNIMIEESFDPKIQDARELRIENIRIQGLSFRYEYGSRPSLAIEDLHLNLKGQKIGIFGPIGSGKTTLMRILSATLIPESGQVLFNQTNAYGHGLIRLRSSFSVVSQEVFLFSRSIRENLDFYSRSSDEELWQAVEFAELKEDIEGFAEGLSTVVGERGVRLSHGQKQRISIARAILGGADVLVLDDCFSALDTVVEERILRNLLRLKSAGGLILCSHRISTLKHCDRILVLDRGRIVGDGNHEELIEHSDFYARMVEKQRSVA